MHKIYAVLLSFLVFNSLVGQDIKLIDYQPLYKKLRVSERTTTEVKTLKGTPDTTVYGHAQFNEQGEMVHYTEYFARGRKMAEYSYEYDSSGKVFKNTVSTTFNDWQPVEILLSFDAAGKLMGREIVEDINNFWKKETYQYNKSGVLIKSEKWYNIKSELVLMDTKNYPQTNTGEENTLTFIHDENGMLLIHQLYNPAGKVERSWRYTYKYR